MNAPVLYPQQMISNVNTLLEKYFENLFDPTNTDTGTDTVSINTNNGVAIFTDPISANSLSSVFIINNSLITSTSAVDFEIIYDVDNNNGVPVFTSYKAINGQIQLWLYNQSAQQTNSGVSVQFKIIPQS